MLVDAMERELNWVIQIYEPCGSNDRFRSNGISGTTYWEKQEDTFFV